MDYASPSRRAATERVTGTLRLDIDFHIKWEGLAAVRAESSIVDDE
jgi:hypothetical protein